MTLGYVSDPIYLQHRTGGHPERTARLDIIQETLDRYGLFERMAKFSPRLATEQDLLRFHALHFVSKLRNFAAYGGGNWDIDTVVSPMSYEVALWAVGGSLAAVDTVMEGKVKQIMALIRPPGHHAEKDRAMGFCLFNNVVLAAKYAQEKYGLKRILIVDWDVHHGNGTNSAFYSDPSVLFFSSHQAGIFPHSGWSNETGTGEGEGYSINCPLPSGTGDEAFYYLFTKLLLPAAQQYKPELVLISCGLDAHFSDPLASLNLTCHGFSQIARIVKDIADESCDGKIVSLLEGGYSLHGVGHAAAAVLNAWGDYGIPVREPMAPPSTSILPAARDRIDETIKIHKKYWKL